MPNKLKLSLLTILRTGTRLLLWFLVFFVFIFISLSILIRVPFIQKKLITYVTNSISNKTHTKIEIAAINLSFPNSISIRGLYLEDTNKDTLLYVGLTKANIAFRKLLIQEIHINSIGLENVKMHLNNSATDTLFNYQFLLNAFNGKTNQKNTDKNSNTKWTFALSELKLTNIYLLYNDLPGGTYISIKLKKMGMEMSKLDLKHAIYSIENSSIEALNAQVLIKKKSIEKEKKSDIYLPFISINRLQIKESEIRFNDSFSNLSLLGFIKNFNFKNGVLDLRNEVLKVDKLSLLKSTFNYENINPVSTKPIDSKTITTNSHWQILSNEINFVDNSLSYKTVPTPLSKASFNSSNWVLNHFYFIAKDLYYSTNKLNITIKKCSTIDNNNFTLKQFETDFEMDQHSITVNKLKIFTTNSFLSADIKLGYSSLLSLQDSLSNTKVILNLENSKFTHSDLLYFNPQLTNTLQNRRGSTTFSAKIEVSINKIKGRGIILKTGKGTIIKTNFQIDGLTKYETAFFSFPDLHVHSNKEDLKSAFNC